MHKLTQIFTILFCGILLTGCESKKTVVYFMQHPDELKQVVDRCEANQNQTQDEAATCHTAVYAASSLMTLIKDQQENPEGFGQRILDAQNRYMQLKAEYNKTHQRLSELNASHASDAAIRNAKDDLFKARQACQEQKENIDIMLAVLGLSSPE